jgi:hypothetical protein
MFDLTPEQIARVEYLATDQWVVDDDSPDSASRSWQNFQRAIGLMSSLELHHFACNFNWDCGVDELEAVIDHPACDAGTALMIYWLGQPATHYRMAARRKSPDQPDDVEKLLRKIEAKIVNNGFRSNAIACDPTNIMGRPMTRGSDRDREVVPAQMFDAIRGVEIVPQLC